MTQIANVLAVATVFIDLWTLLSTCIVDSQRSLIGENKVPMQELEPKVQGRLMHERGHNCGILRYMCCVVVRRGKACCTCT